MTEKLNADEIVEDDKSASGKEGDITPLAENQGEEPEISNEAVALGLAFLISIVEQPIAIFSILDSTNKINALLIYFGVAFLVAVILQLFRKGTAFLLLMFLVEYSTPILGTRTERNFGVEQLALVNIVVAGAAFGVISRGGVRLIFSRVRKKPKS